MLWRIFSGNYDITQADFEIFEEKIDTDWKEYPMEEIISNLESLWSLRDESIKRREFLSRLKSRYSEKETCLI